MENVVIAFGLVFVLEGAFLTLWPDNAKKMMAYFMAFSSRKLRNLGLAMTIFGAILIACVRGL